MGEKVVADGFGPSDRQQYRRKLQQCLAGLARLLAEKRFDRPRNLMGVEIELNLAGPDGLPRMLNGPVLEKIASPDFQTELGMFNLEVNIAPTSSRGAYSTGSRRRSEPESATPTARPRSWTRASS